MYWLRNRLFLIRVLSTIMFQLNDNKKKQVSL